MSGQKIANNNIIHATTKAVSKVYHKMHWFTDKEAWAIFRLFAIAEAVGWTMLIGAIVYRHIDPVGGAIAVTIAGRIHGLLFSLYFVSLLLTARSMLWGFWRVFTGLAAGIMPYTSLVFEKGMAYHRKKFPTYVVPPKNLD